MWNASGILQKCQTADCLNPHHLDLMGKRVRRKRERKRDKRDHKLEHARECKKGKC